MWWRRWLFGVGAVGLEVDVGLDGGEGGAKAVFDFGGDVVGLGEGECWVEFDVEVDDAQASVASGAEMMEVFDSGGGGDDGAYAVEFVGGEGCLKQFGYYGLAYLICHHYDEDADEYGGDGVEDAPLLTEKHGSGDAEQGGDGG